MEAKSYVVAKFDFETKDENAFSFSTGAFFFFFLLKAGLG